MPLRRSWYYPYFRRGAALVPRRCWFVDVVDVPVRGLVAVVPSGRFLPGGGSAPEVCRAAVEEEFLYGVLTSAEVLPFAHLRPPTAVLPARPGGGGFEVLSRERALRLGRLYLAGWFSRAELVWGCGPALRGGPALRSLASQGPVAGYLVVYPASASRPVSCVVRSGPAELRVPGGRAVLRGVLADASLYWYGTDDEDEAHYLAAVLNSSTLDELVRRSGARRIHKKPLELPIPRYDPGNRVHRELARLGREAAERARRALPTALGRRGSPTPRGAGRAREALRRALSGLLSEVDRLVAQLLETSGG